MYDVIIIGKGPAGISASLYIKRANLKILVIGKDTGALEKAKTIENYYGITASRQRNFRSRNKTSRIIRNTNKKWGSFSNIIWKCIYNYHKSSKISSKSNIISNRNQQNFAKHKRNKRIRRKRDKLLCSMWRFFIQGTRCSSIRKWRLCGTRSARTLKFSKNSNNTNKWKSKHKYRKWIN